MSHSEVNPYAPPTATGGRANRLKSAGSLPIAVASGIGALAFIAFTIVLLRSSPLDQKSGVMFLANVPVAIGLFISAIRSTRISAYFATFAAGIQIAITVVMLLMSMGDAAIVIAINSGITIGFLTIAAWAWVSDRRPGATEYSVGEGVDQSR